MSTSPSPRGRAVGACAIALAVLHGSALTAQTLPERERTLPPPGRTAPLTAADQRVADADDTILLSPFEVAASTDTGYIASTSLSGTRVATAIADLPMTVNVMTKDFLQDIGVEDLQDAVRYTAGAYQAESIIGDQNAFQIRGMIQNYSLRNGFRSPTQPTFFGVQRVEVVKGPASVLYGQAYPGGVLNFITRKPQAQQRTEIMASYSSEGSYTATFDTTGSLTDDDSLQFRVMGGHRYFDRLARYAEFTETAGNFQLRWRPVRWLQLDGEIERTERDEVPAGGHVVYNEQDFDAHRAGTLAAFGNPSTWTGYAPWQPRDWNNMGPDHFRDRKVTNASLGAEIILSDTWRFRSTNVMLKERNSSLVRYFNTARRSGIHIPVRDNYRPLQTRDEWFTQNDLTATFTVGDIKNNVLLGYEAYDTRFYQSEELRSAVVNGRVTALFPEIPGPANEAAPYPFHILPMAVSPTVLNGGSIFTGDRGRVRIRGWGVYATDQINLLDERLFFMLAGRYESFNANGLEEDATTGQFGGLYKLYRNPETQTVVSPFFSISQSFRPNTAFDPVTKDPFPPELGKAWEVGLKAELLQGKLNVTTSYFDIVRERVQATIAIRDADNNVTGYRAALNGEEVSRGWEVEGIYSPVTNYQIVFSYSNIDSFISVPGDALVAAGILPGQKLSTPDYTASLWNRYRFEEGRFRGLSAGLGISRVGSRLAGNYGNQTGGSRWTFENEAYTRFDALLGYGWKANGRSWNLSLNIQNLTDEIYYIGTSTRIAEPRTFLGTLRVSF